MIADEINFVIERENGRMVTEANLMRSIVLGTFSKNHKSEFTKKVKALNVRTKARASLFEPE